ncbi:NADH-quinone oxidoreductase subunit I [Desulfovibrio sp.]|uniref:NuoI/complex I 23 kDa subunit family protein n=1 Tax=Desulfovibrio sp. TaxID=885 RepID=UPI0035B3F608
MNTYFKNIFSGGWSLCVGMGITLRYFFKPVVTKSYPHEVLPITPRYRGHIDLVYDAQTGTDRCIVCGSCQKACPSGCIELAGEKLEGAKKKTLTSYKLDFTKCSLCGMCVESCPTDALTFSHDYNLAGFDEAEYHFDLVRRLKERS